MSPGCSPCSAATALNKALLALPAPLWAPNSANTFLTLPGSCEPCHACLVNWKASKGNGSALLVLATSSDSQNLSFSAWTWRARLFSSSLNSTMAMWVSAVPFPELVSSAPWPDTGCCWVVLEGAFQASWDCHCQPCQLCCLGHLQQA